MTNKYAELRDKTAFGNFRNSKNAATGRFDVGGNEWPKAAVGVANILVVEDHGRLKALIVKRGNAVAHAGKWGVVGGYLDQEKGESIEQCSRRETLEETSNLVDLKGLPSQPLGAIMDYADSINGQCCANGLMYLLPEKLAQVVINGLVKDGKGSNSEVAEFRLLDIKTMEQEVERLGGPAAFGYQQDLAFLLRAAKELSRAKGQAAAVG